MTDVNPPPFFDILLESCKSAVIPHSFMGPLEYQWFAPHATEHGRYEINIFPTSSELVGGPNDGLDVVPLYHVNVNRFLSSIDNFIIEWHPFADTNVGDGAMDGSSLRVTGELETHPVLINFYCFPPEDAEPAYYTNKDITKHWPRNPSSADDTPLSG